MMGKKVNPQQLKTEMERLRCEPLSSGYRSIDELTGGLVRGGVVLLAARPAMGVTPLILNMISRIVQNEQGGILFFSTEFSEREVASRILEIGMDVEPGRLLDGKMPAKEGINRCADFLQSLKGRIRIETFPMLTLEDIRYYCEETANLRLVVVDHPECIYRSMENPFEEADRLPMDHVLRYLRHLAADLNVPVLCKTGLDRKLELREDKRPRLTDLKKGVSAELADQVLLLYRDSYYDPSYDDTAECIVAKTCCGHTGTAKMLWDWNTNRFEDDFDEFLPF